MSKKIAPLTGGSSGISFIFPVHRIPEEFFRYIRDGLVDKPGKIRQRGPLTAATDTPTIATARGFGIGISITPTGSVRSFVLSHNSSSNAVQLGLLSSDYTSVSTTKTLSTTTTGALIADSGPKFNGGTFVGFTNKYKSAAPVDSGLLVWNGANKADYTTGTITTTINSKTVTGSSTVWLTNAEPGMYLLTSTGTYLGQVETVGTDTSITLKENVAQAVSGVAYILTSVRAMLQKHMTGFITSVTTSTTVTGSNTKFSKHSFASGWRLYRARDMTFVGEVTSVTDDDTLVLTANASIAMSNERYIAFDKAQDVRSSAYGNHKAGVLTAVYAGFQWYANRSKNSTDDAQKIWFSDLDDPEAIDLASDDGDFFIVTSEAGHNPITKIVATTYGLIIFKENELFIVRGSSPENFTLEKIANIGAPCGMSIVYYNQKILFASNRGIHSYDGIELLDLTPQFGSFLEEALMNYTLDTDRMWGMFYNQHYFVFMENLSPPIKPTKVSTAETDAKQTMCLNLLTGASTLLTNVNIRGATLPGAIPGKPVWFLVNSSAPTTSICDASKLFTITGADAITCEGATVGPRFFVESPRYDLGDPSRLKRWLELQIYGKISGDTLTVNTLKGNTDTGAALSDVLEATSPAANQRVRFGIRDQFFGFRIYPTAGTATNVELDGFAVGVSPLRMRITA